MCKAARTAPGAHLNNSSCDHHHTPDCEPLHSLPTSATHLGHRTHLGQLPGCSSTGRVLRGPCFLEDMPGFHQRDVEWTAICNLWLMSSTSFSTMRSSYFASYCLVISEGESQRFSSHSAFPIILTHTFPFNFGYFTKKVQFSAFQGPNDISKL